MDIEQMGWLAWLIVGAIAGWLAGMSRSRVIGDIAVGITGAFIGGFLFNLVSTPGATGFNTWSIFVAFVGAAVLLLGIHMLDRRPNITNQ